MTHRKLFVKGTIVIGGKEHVILGHRKGYEAMETALPLDKGVEIARKKRR